MPEPRVETFEEVVEAIAEKRIELGDPPMDDDFRSRYRAKWDLTERYVKDLGRPAEIFEIGVRAGYFARIMLAAAGPGASYVGVDNDTHGHLSHALPFLAGYEARIILGDSHDLVGLDQDFDLIHVDGDHSAEGCLADLRLVFPHAKRAVFVDDVMGMERVQKACSIFIAELLVGVSWYTDMGELWKGTFVIEKEAP